MSDTESDEDLRKAIALSLQQSSPPRKKDRDAVIDLVSSDEEDDDLDAPVNARLKQNASNPKLIHRSEVVASTTGIESSQNCDSDTVGNAISTPGVRPTTATSSVSMPKTPEGTFLKNMDRARMEEERLQRVARMRKLEEDENVSRKRKEPDSSFSSPDYSGHQLQTRKVSKVSSKDHVPTNISPESKDRSQILPLARPLTLTGNSTDKPLGVLSFQDQQRLGEPGIQFPYGVVKKTWVYGCPRTGDDIKIEEVLQKGDLDLAVLSAFQIETDWITSKLNPSTKVIWVLQAKGQSQKDNIRSGAPANYRFCFPSMEGNVNCMHSKLQLLAHKTHLRIVVPSANLTSYDWGESGQMENVLFLIDLPRIKSQESHDELTAFGRELLYYLKAMGLNENTLDSIKCFDFRNTEKLAFVHSIGGSHLGSNLFRTGVCGLGKAVGSLGLNTEEALNIDFLAASIGSLNDSFLKSIYLAAQGDNGLKEYKWRTDKGLKIKSKDSEAASDRIADELKSNVRIYFPTRQTIENSKGGKAAGGTICFQRKWYDAVSFDMARNLMVNCKSVRKGILMHSKMIFTRPQKGIGGKPWVYVGSANLSESAWGRLGKNRKGELTLNCRNWECGVIVPVHATDKAGYSGSAPSEAEHEDPPVGTDVFRGQIPVPMVVPGEAYVKYGEEPWFYSEHL